MSASRRTVLTGLAAGGAAVPLLAACGSSSATDTSTTSTTGSTSGSPSGSTGSNALAKTADIPVGGGKLVESAQVVVTQPTAGQFKAFTAVCTHQGCLVSNTIQNNKINCPCHGSAFSATDGSVINGPARSPLAAKSITVSNGEILLG